MGSCCRLNGNSAGCPRNLRRQISRPPKSQHPISPAESKNHTNVPSVTGDHDVASLYEYATGLGLAESPVRFTDQRIRPVARSIACPCTLTLVPVAPAGNVSRNNRSPQTAIPPCPSFGSAPFQTIPWFAATLHFTGASAAATLQFPFGPAACGQFPPTVPSPPASTRPSLPASFATPASIPAPPVPPL